MHDESGWVMNGGWTYDAMVWVFDKLIFRGKLRGAQERAIELAALRPGHRVLDVGCGTGTLALMAAARVGPTGHVAGIDPGERQLERARARAARRGLDIDFTLGVIQELPFPDRSFDAVLSSLMLHHLPDPVKRQGLAEVARVLKPGGRLVVVDFKRPASRDAKPRRFGAGEIAIQDLPGPVAAAGLVDVAAGDLDAPRIPRLGGIGWLRASAAA